MTLDPFNPFFGRTPVDLSPGSVTASGPAAPLVFRVVRLKVPASIAEKCFNMNSFLRISLFLAIIGLSLNALGADYRDEVNRLWRARGLQALDKAQAALKADPNYSSKLSPSEKCALKLDIGYVAYTTNQTEKTKYKLTTYDQKAKATLYDLILDGGDGDTNGGTMLRFEYKDSDKEPDAILVDSLTSKWHAAVMPKGGYDLLLINENCMFGFSLKRPLDAEVVAPPKGAPSI